VAETIRCAAKTRYRQPDQDCVVEPLGGGTRLKVRFDQPQRAITPGQSVVFYEGEVCLGGGIIEVKYNED
jgi:tRNA-specific 2-thiouridylase